MAISPSEFQYRASQLQTLPYQESSRLIGFVEWLEEDENASKLLADLRAVDLETLLKDCNYQRAPRPKSPKEVAAIGLCTVDTCKQKNTDLFQLAHSLGAMPSSNRLQDYSDLLLERYVHPFIEYVGTHLFSDMTSEAGSDEHLMPTNTTDVFVVHGRDNEAKETVSRFIERLGLNPIILHEQANKGRTIIEKFEDHAEVQFAVILLTPDEVGRLASEPSAELELQARQNVIFEMGYFLGRIGRERVFALKKGDVQVPSDYDGVVYTPMDSAGAWKMHLVRELKAAGFEVDANKAF
ncbi:MAG TPA: nucleotide-binding protein [Chthoniobacter sp.]|jgi:predicted nucleotide-binding protein